MVKVARYHPEDLLQVPLRSIVGENIDHAVLLKAAQGHGAFPVAFTVKSADGDILGCFGVDDLWPGTGQLWSAFAEGTLVVPGAYRKLRIVVQKVWDQTEQFGYNRWQAAVSVDDPEGVRLIEHLGLEKESLMKRYGPNDADHWLYAKVRA